MENLGDHSFIPTNLGRVDEEMIPSGRGVSQVKHVFWRCMAGRRITQVERTAEVVDGECEIIIREGFCNTTTNTLNSSIRWATPSYGSLSSERIL
ncbi:hypothetical protein TNCV_5038851 [Trichonephila clavipes]|nr:hypothetical protein TNCV_5038851 [Trichonephila clavipes]